MPRSFILCSRQACASLAVVTALATAACSPGISPNETPQAHSRTIDSELPFTTTPIKHVVFIIQENRSFNNLFMNYPGATTAAYGYDSHGKKVRVRPRNLWSKWDPAHNSAAFFTDCHGKGEIPGTKCLMNGWNKERSEPGAPPNLAYAYVPQSQIAPYWALAHQYVLADDMFASNIDGSFVSHQYAIAAFAEHAVDYPVAAWGCEGGASDTVTTLTKMRRIGKPIVACFNDPTIASESDAAGLAWRFYADSIYAGGGIWSAYQANRPVYDGPEWQTNVINPPAQFLADIANDKLAAVTWITPTWGDSDHPPATKGGPAWIASVVDAIGSSKYWKSTAIFIMWDDWGGWFDPAKPPFEDYDGLGFRVPLLVVSPYALKGSVTHTQYETASVLRFIEDNFGLGQLAKSDARANDPAGDSAVFDFRQNPRRFKKIAGSMPATYWLENQRKPSQPPPGESLGD